MQFSDLEVLSFLISAGQVFIMVPGLALFYGGLVRHKNVIGTMMHSITAISVVSVLWVLWGYSLAFGNSVGGLGFVGDLSKFGMVGVPLDEQSFMVFQGMFAIITAALISGDKSQGVDVGRHCVSVADNEKGRAKSPPRMTSVSCSEMVRFTSGHGGASNCVQVCPEGHFGFGRW